MDSENRQINEQLLRIRRGESEAFDALYNLTSKVLYTLCYSFFGNRYDSEDALYDAAYMTAIDKIKRFNGINGFNWLYTITKNICINILRRKKRQVSYDFQDEVAVQSLNMDAVSPQVFDESGVLQVAKKVLSKKELFIVIAHAVQGYKFMEIASVTGGLETTTRWQYNNAIKKVRRAYDKAVEND